MTLSNRSRGLLTAWLLMPWEAPTMGAVMLSRWYLCHLATGGACYELHDLTVVDKLLGRWLAEERL